MGAYIIMAPRFTAHDGSQMRERVRTAQVSSVEGAKRLAQWFLPQLRLANELLREDSRQRGRANRVNEPPARVVEYCNRRRRD